MSLNLNYVSMAGRICADPELKTTNAGRLVTSFTLAISRGKDRTDFIPCVAWQKCAEFICNNFKKGAAIYCGGSLEMRKYAKKDGTTSTAYEVNVREK